MTRFPLRSQCGQFIPISAMVMFTTMLFLLAIVNIYAVAKAKLKVQNLADAAALNLATQAAQSYNVVTDKNEWLNRMTAGVASPSDPNAPADIKDCSRFNMGRPNDLLIPPVVCVENTINPDSPRVFSRRVWNTRGDASGGAIGYAMLIHTINQSQKMFVQAYNSFLGAQGGGVGSASSTSGPSNFEGLLKKDIPELDNPDIHLIAWNSGELSQEDAKEQVKDSNVSFDSKRMRPLKFEIDHDLQTRYVSTGRGGRVETTTLGNLIFGRINYGPRPERNGPLYGQQPVAVGWMVPARDQPTIPVGQGSHGSQVGVGVYVSKEVTKLPIVGSITVWAKSKAYVVQGSGETGDHGGRPIFRPTYWVKLAN